MAYSDVRCASATCFTTVLHSVPQVSRATATCYAMACNICAEMVVVPGPHTPRCGYLHLHLTWLYAAQGRYGDAKPLYKRALAIDENGLRSGASGCRHQPQTGRQRPPCKIGNNASIDQVAIVTPKGHEARFLWQAMSRVARRLEGAFVHVPRP